MATALLTQRARREVASAIDDLVTDLAMRVGRIVPRRSDIRYPMNAPVNIGTTGADGSFIDTCPGWALDLSALGIGVICERPWTVGDALALRLKGADGRSHVVPLRVVHVERLFGNVHRFGARFLIERPW